MTFSIVAISDDQHWLGVTVASRVLAVGRAVPAAAVGAGAVATQAMCNMSYRPRGIEMLRAGLSAADVVSKLTGDDADRDRRQVGVVDHRGTSASHTGRDCLPWAGGVTGPGYAIQGNILAGPHVLEAMERAWRSAGPTEPLGRRLVTALLAGDRAGGDRRGRQSAGILVVTPDGAHEAGRTAGHYDVNDEHTSLRVDDHADPVFELMRLVGLRDVSLGVRAKGTVAVLDGQLLADVAILLDRLGHPRAAVDAEAVTTALRSWAFTEDLDERLDLVVLHYLRYRAGAWPAFGA